MDKIEDEVQEIAAAHTRRIDQVEGENHDLSCQNTRLKTENENQQEQIDALQNDLEIRSMSLEDMMQYSRRKRPEGRIQMMLSKTLLKTNWTLS